MRTATPAHYISLSAPSSLPATRTPLSLTSLTHSLFSLLSQVLKGDCNPKVLCIVGTGVQARSHAEAFKLICPFDEASSTITHTMQRLFFSPQIRVWGRNANRAKQCVDDIGSGCVAYESLQDACNGADVVVTVTMATDPVLCGKWVKDGAIVCGENDQIRIFWSGLVFRLFCTGIGACRPDWREIDDELMNNSVVVVDSRAAAEKESGDIVLSGVSVVNISHTHLSHTCTLSIAT